MPSTGEFVLKWYFHVLSGGEIGTCMKNFSSMFRSCNPVILTLGICKTIMRDKHKNNDI